MELVIGNSIVYVLCWTFYIYKKRKLDVGFVLLTIYSISAIVGIFYYQTNEFDFKIRMLPYVYLLFSFFICFYPFLCFDSSRIKNIRINCSKNFIKYLSFVSIITTIEVLLENIYILFSYSITTFAFIYNKEIDVFDQYTFLGKQCYIFANIFQYILPLLFYIYLSKYKIKKIYVFFFVLALLNPFLKSLVSASRGDIFSFFAYNISLFIFIRHILCDKYQRKIWLFFVISLIFFVVSVLAISFSRYIAKNSSSDFFNYFIIYIGEGQVNFNSFIWDQNIYTEGDKTISIFKSILGYDVPIDPLDLQYKWEITGVSQRRFYTFVGDFVSDYGAFGALMFFFILNLLVKKNLKNKSYINLDSLFLIMIILYVFVYGYSLFAFRRYYQQTILLVNILFYLLFVMLRLMTNSQFKRNI